jgi:hypothetical protein
MSSPTIIGIFDSMESAQLARAALLDSGLAAQHISVSADLTRDDIAAEAPGQSYGNQSYSAPPDEGAQARYNSAVRTGACVVSVSDPPAGEGARIERLMRAHGARGTLEREP